MSINILGGKARGFKLQVPPDSITRPTSVMLKRRLFDWRQDWSDHSFVDLCAGSGAMGFEALSRGAKTVWLNEPNKTAYKILEKNAQSWIDKIKLDEQKLHLSSRPFLNFLPSLLAQQSEEMVIFFDPPYENHRMYDDFWQALSGFQGELWVESDNLKGVKLDDQRQHLSEVVKELTQGSHWMLVGRGARR